MRLGVHSRRGALAALVALTLIWGANWAVMKAALGNADPVVFNLQRTWLAVAVLFAVLAARGGPFRPPDWTALLVTGFFQTTINFGATTMALSGGGASHHGDEHGNSHSDRLSRL